MLLLSLSSVLPTQCERITLLNYRVIVVNALIYNLIATAEMLHDFDKSAVSTPTATNANNRNVDNSRNSAAAAMQMPTMSDIFMRDNDNCRHSNNNNNNKNNNGSSISRNAADKHDADAVPAFTANSAVTVVGAATSVVVGVVENCTAAINVHVDNLENRKNQMALLAYRNMSTISGRTATTTKPTTLATISTQPTTSNATTIAANPRTSTQSQPATTTATTTTTVTTTPKAMPTMYSHDLLSPTNGTTSSSATQMSALPTTQTQTQKFTATTAAAATSSLPASSSLSSSAVQPTRPTQVSTQQSAAVATAVTAATPLQLQSPTTKATPKPTTTTATTMQTLPTLQSHWQRVLSRPKRYLAFPEGSSFSVAVCITVGIVGNPRYNYMSYGLNWGVAYDLPNATWVLLNLHGLMRRPVPTAVLRRRTRRTLYSQMEDIMDNMGYNGRDCVLRALCESRQYFTKTKMGMIGEMLRVVFSLPKQRILRRELEENSDIAAYDHAYRKASAVDCASHYDCGFSLLELAFGKYANPPPNYYEQFGM